jgi:hypothetical protein
MNEELNYYCGLFLDSSEEESLLVSEVAKLFNNEPERNYIHSSECDISILENDDFDEQRRTNPEDGFLFYRYKLEVEPNTELGEKNAIAVVSKLLKFFWSQSYPAVAACGYEDALPNKGKLIPENHSWNEYYIWK